MQSALEKNHESRLVSRDFSATFDNGNHNSLIFKCSLLVLVKFKVL